MLEKGFENCLSFQFPTFCHLSSILSVTLRSKALVICSTQRCRLDWKPRSLSSPSRLYHSVACFRNSFKTLKQTQTPKPADPNHDPMTKKQRSHVLISTSFKASVNLAISCQLSLSVGTYKVLPSIRAHGWPTPSPFKCPVYRWLTESDNSHPWKEYSHKCKGVSKC